MFKADLQPDKLSWTLLHSLRLLISSWMLIYSKFVYKLSTYYKPTLFRADVRKIAHGLVILTIRYMLPADGPLCIHVVFVYAICEILDMQCLIRTSLKGRRLLCLVYIWS